MTKAAEAWEGPTAAELKAAGAEAIPGGVRVKGWVIRSHNGPILNSASLQLYDPLPILNPNLFFLLFLTLIRWVEIFTLILSRTLQ